MTWRRVASRQSLAGLTCRLKFPGPTPMLDFSAHALPYASQRSPVHARRGMVATSQPQAAQVGLEILRRGGNAIDAAIATAAALTVVEPTGCGIGGDAFALVWTRGRLHGLDASGRAPGLLDRERVRAAGHERMPLYGWTPVTVPGCPAAWGELSRRFGKLPFEQLLRPAIEAGSRWLSGLAGDRPPVAERPGQVPRGVAAAARAAGLVRRVPHRRPGAARRRGVPPAGPGRHPGRAGAQPVRKLLSRRGWPGPSSATPSAAAATCARRTWPATRRSGSNRSH